MRKRYLANIIVAAAVIFGGFILCVFHPAQDVSVAERRKLAQFPTFTAQSVLSGSWMEDFEDYAMDQFPFRDALRSVKAYVQQDVFLARDNNGIYVADGSASKLEYPLSEDGVLNATNKLNDLYETYMAGTDVSVYYSVVPDKNYFLAEANGYPSMDYARLVELLSENISNMEYIDLFPYLDIGDYYRTDPHWSQDKILDAADALADSMGVGERMGGAYETRELYPFYGAYYGQSALAMRPDTLCYLTNDIIENCTVWNAETGETGLVYDEANFDDVDPYDVFLSGAAPLLVINNPAGEPGSGLVIFRDSYGSSLAPLLLEAYETVTLVDLRYMSSSLLEQYVTFDDQDVLFMYCPSVWNNGRLLR